MILEAYMAIGHEPVLLLPWIGFQNLAARQLRFSGDDKSGPGSTTGSQELNWETRFIPKRKPQLMRWLLRGMPILGHSLLVDNYEVSFNGERKPCTVVEEDRKSVV